MTLVLVLASALLSTPGHAVAEDKQPEQPNDEIRIVITEMMMEAGFKDAAVAERDFWNLWAEWVALQERIRDPAATYRGSWVQDRKRSEQVVEEMVAASKSIASLHSRFVEGYEKRKQATEADKPDGGVEKGAETDARER